jgi:hypothetical protein
LLELPKLHIRSMLLKCSSKHEEVEWTARVVHDYDDDDGVARVASRGTYDEDRICWMCGTINEKFDTLGPAPKEEDEKDEDTGRMVGMEG